MNCHYCKYFADADREKKNKRLCPIIEKPVESDDEWCNNFKARSCFWCKSNCQWIFLESCEYKAQQTELNSLYCDEECSQYSNEVKLILEKKRRKLAKIKARGLKKKASKKRTLKRRS